MVRDLPTEVEEMIHKPDPIQVTLVNRGGETFLRLSGEGFSADLNQMDACVLSTQVRHAFDEMESGHDHRPGIICLQCRRTGAIQPRRSTIQRIDE